jgi:hypothetical protein
MQDRKREYLEAHEASQAQLQAMHCALLEGEHLEPPKLKALLNRSRARSIGTTPPRMPPGLSEQE